MTSEALAARTGFHERWVHEWLRAQAVANFALPGAGPALYEARP